MLTKIFIIIHIFIILIALIRYQTWPILTNQAFKFPDKLVDSFQTHQERDIRLYKYYKKSVKLGSLQG